MMKLVANHLSSAMAQWIAMESPTDGMFLVHQAGIDCYLERDTTIENLNAFARNGDESWICQKWLRESEPKRFIFSALYGDLLTATRPLRVLDVGGGLTSFTRELARRHDYRLVDMLAHDSAVSAAEIANELGRDFLWACDWATLSPARYDLVIANDLFPNVDQRLEIFLDRFLQQTDSIRMSLTYYDAPRYYMTRRIDAEEILCMLAWDGRHLRSILERFETSIVCPNLALLSSNNHSVYANGRQVCLVEFRSQPYQRS